jgi:hypothetical protein
VNDPDLEVLRRHYRQQAGGCSPVTLPRRLHATTPLCTTALTERQAPATVRHSSHTVCHHRETARAKLTHILLTNGGTLCREAPQAPLHWLSLSFHALLCRVRFLRPLPCVFALLRRLRNSVGGVNRIHHSTTHAPSTLTGSLTSTPRPHKPMTLAILMLLLVQPSRRCTNLVVLIIWISLHAVREVVGRNQSDEHRCDP